MKKHRLSSELGSHRRQSPRLITTFLINHWLSLSLSGWDRTDVCRHSKQHNERADALPCCLAALLPLQKGDGSLYSTVCLNAFTTETHCMLRGLGTLAGCVMLRSCIKMTFTCRQVIFVGAGWAELATPTSSGRCSEVIYISLNYIYNYLVILIYLNSTRLP